MRARKRDRGNAAKSNAGAPRTRGKSGSPRAKGGGNRGRPGGGGGGGGGGANRARKGRGKEAELWGDAGLLPAPRTDVRITDDPAAVPRSLGKPPLPGHEVIAEHYFGVVYERAVMTAGALAAAGGLIDHAALAGDRDDT